MVDFSAHMAGLDAAIDSHLRDAAWLRPAGGGPDRAIRVVLEHPSEVERLDAVGIGRDRPWVEISRSSCPALAKGDVVMMGPGPEFQGWRLAERPVAALDGRQWRATVEPIGVVQ